MSWTTAIFLHGGWDHILGNMLFLAIFGKNVEDAFGPLRYAVFYFAGSLVAIMTQTAMTLLFGTAADGQVPTLGASGAIAVVLGAYFVLYPGSRILTFVFFFLGMRRPVPTLTITACRVPRPLEFARCIRVLVASRHT